MAKPKGHKKNCRCAICKNARKGKGGKRSKGTGSHTAADRRAHLKRLRDELRSVKIGLKAAAKNGDAKSWSSFFAKQHRLVGQIRGWRN